MKYKNAIENKEDAMSGVYRGVVERIPIGALVLNSESTIILMNPAAQRIKARPGDWTGLPLQDLLSELVDKEQSRALVLELRKAATTGKAVSEELSIGTRVFAFTSFSLPSVGDGASGHQLILFQEITDAKLSEKECLKLLIAIQHERERLFALLNSISDEIWFANKQGQYTMVNPSALREFNLNISDGIGVETLAKKLEVLRPDSSPRPVEEAPPLIALKGKEVKNQEEIVRTPATGELRYRQVSASPVRNANGDIIGAISVVRDITDQKKAEESLRESETRYRSLFENMITGYAYCKILLDKENKPADFIYLDVNDAFEKLTGLKKETVLGKKATEAIPKFKEAHPGVFDIYGQVAMTGEKRHFEIYFKPIQAWLSISVHSHQKGYFVAIFENITDRKHREEVMLNSERRLRSLSSQLLSAHEDERRRISLELHDEMGQALTAIDLNLSEIEKAFLPDTDGITQEILKETRSIVEQVLEEIRELSHNLRPSMLDDLGLLPTLRWHLNRLAQRTGLNVKFDAIEMDKRLDKDSETVIYRIVQEALNNVVRHAGAKRITVSLQRKEDSVACFIEDDGKGFNVNKIWSQKTPLSGIGIVGMQERAAMVGGSLAIISQEGHGTRISVELPLHWRDM